MLQILLFNKLYIIFLEIDINNIKDLPYEQICNQNKIDLIR